jgi:hypothetical protein
MNQPEIGHVSIQTSAPNPLTEFINVYSDDEILGEYQRTPVCVQEEKGAEKDFPPETEVQTQEVPQNETQFKSGIEMKGLDASKTRADNLKDEPKPDEPKEASLQKEIIYSTTNKKVSNKSVLDVSTPLNTQVPEK